MTKETAVKEWMNVDDVAAYLSLSPKTIRNYVSQGLIPHNKVRGILRFKKDRIDLWLDTGRVETREEYMYHLEKERSD